MKLLYPLLTLVCLLHPAISDANEQRIPRPSKKVLPKDPLFMTDLDLEALYDQWEDSDDERLPVDELEPHKRPAPTLHPDILKKAGENPELAMRLSKQGKVLMAFVTVAGKPSREETEEITKRWQTGLQNAHVTVQRFIIEDNRAIFTFQDGMQAFEYKDYFLSQPELSEYVVEGRSYHGKGYPVEYPHASKLLKADKTVIGDEIKVPKNDEL